MEKKRFTLCLAKIYLLLSFMSVLNFIGFSQTGCIRGKVIDISSKEPVPFANIIIFNSVNKLVGGATSDFDGNYQIDSIIPGKYKIESKFVGYQTYLNDSLKVTSNNILFYDILMTATAEMLEEVLIVDYYVPLIDKDQTTTGATVTANSIRKMNKASCVVRGARSDNYGSVVFNDENYNIQSSSGVLTATEINDFSKWDLWLDISDKEFNEYSELWKIYPGNRYTVQVIFEDNAPVVNAVVKLTDKDDYIIWQALTDNTGKAELWYEFFNNDLLKPKKIIVEYNSNEYVLINPTKFRKGINKVIIPGSCYIPDNIDVCFVVDATGSMSDEIEFLKTDFINLVEKTGSIFPDAVIRTSSVFYRCKGDLYDYRIKQFSDSSLETMDFINQQSAGGGGDEIVEIALNQAIDSLAWSGEARSRLLFLVLDEQPLTNDRSLSIINESILHAAKKGIRIIPVVASAETMYHAHSLEFLMRALALATNGTSVFLTDHSNVGSTHATPTTDRYNVELLNDLIIRLIYQYSVFPPCLGDNSPADTLFINMDAITHEIVDTSRNIKIKIPVYNITDFSEKVYLDNSNDTVSDSTTSESEMPKNDQVDMLVKCFPNPTNGIVNIVTGVNIDELCVFDITGKVIQYVESEEDTSKIIIDISDNANGIYFVKFIYKNNWYSGKIILSK